MYILEITFYNLKGGFYKEKIHFWYVCQSQQVALWFI